MQRLANAGSSPRPLACPFPSLFPLRAPLPSPRPLHVHEGRYVQRLAHAGSSRVERKGDAFVPRSVGDLAECVGRAVRGESREGMMRYAAHHHHQLPPVNVQVTWQWAQGLSVGTAGGLSSVGIPIPHSPASLPAESEVLILSELFPNPHT